jgi:formate-dependent phosphoribosylglycinamide formyltransferase (GAR transformylase)
MMNVIMIAPGYPDEMPLFVRGFANEGANVIGVGDQPGHDVPPLAAKHMAAYVRVPSLQDEDECVRVVTQWAQGKQIDKVICLWEPGVLLAARIREQLGVPGMSVEDANAFRDKDIMKEKVAKAGIRTPKHKAAKTAQGVRAAIKKIGYPVIIKPIAGAGSMDTHRVDNAEELKEVIKKLGHVDHVNVEEFIDGEEYTYDTICVDGKMVYRNIGYYRPRPLNARSNEWISPQTLCLRDLDAPELKEGHEMGQAVIDALNFKTGFTHMEWYRKSNGEVVFGEIAARPAGARTVDLMNFVSDIDLFRGYAEAEIHGRFTQDATRKYNTANIFKRAQGQGRIQRIEGLESIKRRFGPYIVNIDLLPVGAPRRNWVQTLISDGYVTVRHPDLQTLFDIADAVGTDLNLYAG